MPKKSFFGFAAPAAARLELPWRVSCPTGRRLLSARQHVHNMHVHASKLVHELHPCKFSLGMARSAPLTLLLLLCSSVHPAQSGRKRPAKSKNRALRQKLRSGNNLGAWTEATAPMHTTVCGDHTCRPGEGNLKGYKHWSQPYEPAPLAGLSKRAAHGWSKGSAFPSDKYTGLVAAALRCAAVGLSQCSKQPRVTLLHCTDVLPCSRACTARAVLCRNSAVVASTPSGW